MEKDRLIEDIKSRIPSGRKVYLEGVCDHAGRCYLWWYVWTEEDILWVDFEDTATPGVKIQQASDFDAELLESVLDSMTSCTEEI